MLIKDFEKVLGKSYKGKIHFNKVNRKMLLIKLKIYKPSRQNGKELQNLIHFHWPLIFNKLEKL